MAVKSYLASGLQMGYIKRIQHIILCLKEVNVTSLFKENYVDWTRFKVWSFRLGGSPDKEPEKKQTYEIEMKKIT